MARKRRILRVISLSLFQAVWLYYSPHYRTVVQCLLAVGAQIIAVVVILTVFPYDKTQPQEETKAWWGQTARIVAITMVLIGAIWAWMPHPK